MSYEQYDGDMLAMSFQKLLVWQRSMELVKDVYTITKTFPKEELYGITSQIRRSAVSVPSNIAEGSQRTSDKEFSNFILIARGSLAELITQLLIAAELRYGTQTAIEKILKECDAISRKLYAFYSKLTARSSKLPRSS